MIKRAFLNTADGQIHYRMDGPAEPPPIILLHQVPRSSDSFVEVMPLLARKRRVIAMDTIGYGDSDKPPKDKWYTVEDYAKTVIMLLDSLDIEKAVVLGHHTGSKIAVETAAAYPERVERLILLGPYLWKKEEKKDGVGQSGRWAEIEMKEDGSHLMELWRVKGSSVGYPTPGMTPEFTTRRILDILKATDTMHRGHFASASYNQAERLPLIKCPTLAIWGTEDLEMHKVIGLYPGNIDKLIPDCKVEIVEGGTDMLPNQMPEGLARLILSFIND